MHRLRQPCRSLGDRVVMSSPFARKLMQAARRGCCHLLHILKQEECFGMHRLRQPCMSLEDCIVMIQPARKLMQAARRGCCHLSHPLKQEVFRDAQIPATVQVLRRQHLHVQPFRKEADASCEARLLPSVAPFEAGSVLGCTDCGNRAGLWKTESS